MVFQLKNISSSPILFPIFHLNASSLDTISEQISSCLTAKRGCIIFVEKNDVFFSNLSFLKNILLSFHKNSLSFSIWGLPDCVLRFIYGDGFDFTRLHPLSFKEPLYYQSLFQPKSVENSVQLTSCSSCFIKESCLGLGTQPKNLSTWSYRISPELRVKLKENLVFEDDFISSSHTGFLDYIKGSSLYYTDRTLRYVRVFSKLNEFTYSQRFVYFCRFLSKNEYLQEFDFLSQIVVNRKFFQSLFLKFYKPLLMRSIAYSIAKVSKDKYRESFYLYFIDSNNILSVLRNNGISFLLNPFEKLSYLSFDVSSNSIGEVKVYSKIRDVGSFLNYLSVKNNYIFPQQLKSYCFNFYFVRRFSPQGELKSVKFEFNTSNTPLVKELLEDSYGISLENSSSYLKEEIFAIDLNESGEINKITLYYGNF